MENEQKIINWQAPEYEFREKTSDWFWAVIIIVASGGIASIIYKNYLFAVFLILAAVLLLVYSIRKPEIVNFEVSEKDLKIKDEVYLYSDMINFWIDKNHPHKRLLINTNKILAPLIDIPLPDEANEEEIKNILLEKIKEEEIKEPMFHRVMEYLGF